MGSFKEGDVVIVLTGQAGTIIDISGKNALVLLRNGDIWKGLVREIRASQGQEDLDACPIDVERLEPKRVPIERD